MNQNYDFKTNFSSAENIDNSNYDYAGNVRNVCFAFQDGRKSLFNYAYLVSVELGFEKSDNFLIVFFTSHAVTLNGYNLDILFELFMNHMPMFIAETPMRYALNNLQEPLVTKISIKK